MLQHSHIKTFYKSLINSTFSITEICIHLVKIKVLELQTLCLALSERIKNEYMTNFLSLMKNDQIHYQTIYVQVCMLSRFSRVRFFVTPWTVAHQALLSMGFSRQDYWSGLPCPPPGDLPDPGIELASLVAPTLTGKFFTNTATWEALKGVWDILYLRCLSYNCIYSLTFFKPLFKSPFLN